MQNTLRFKKDLENLTLCESPFIFISKIKANEFVLRPYACGA